MGKQHVQPHTRAGRLVEGYSRTGADPDADRVDATARSVAKTAATAHGHLESLEYGHADAEEMREKSAIWRQRSTLGLGTEAHDQAAGRIAEAFGELADVLEGTREPPADALEISKVWKQMDGKWNKESADAMASDSFREREVCAELAYAAYHISAEYRASANRSAEAEPSEDHTTRTETTPQAPNAAGSQEFPLTDAERDAEDMTACERCGTGVKGFSCTVVDGQTICPSCFRKYAADSAS